MLWPKLIENKDWLHDGSSPVLTLCMLGNFSCFCCHLLILSKLTYCRNSFRNTIRGSNDLDPDLDLHSVGPALGPNSLQRFSADDSSRR